MVTGDLRKIKKHPAVVSWRKRIIDIILSFSALLVLSPLLLFVSLLLYVTQGPPILFRQVRAGYKTRPFTLVKFRTMRIPKPGERVGIDDSSRTTLLGRWLRKASIDELPELLNVLHGDMSLVGPRPLLLDYVNKYSVEQNQRHDVKPGITGIAIVMGRQNLTISRRLQYDLWYVENWSPRLDYAILVDTLFMTFRGEGVTMNTEQAIKAVDDLGFNADKGFGRVHL